MYQAPESLEKVESRKEMKKTSIIWSKRFKNPNGKMSILSNVDLKANLA